MPPAPGDHLLTTLFADVHYYFSDPSSKPPHHRFARGSYLYLYHSPDSQQAKLEIANHAGTPDQDAFSGCLQEAEMYFSHKQPILFTFKVNSTVKDQGQWHLPGYDVRNEQKYLQKLHTLDVYLWTEKDAAAFLGHLKGTMPTSKLQIKDAPALPAEHRDCMSPVVQKLEKTAISPQFTPRAESIASQQSMPGPPTPATSGAETSSPSSPGQAAPGAMAYNPAAPAAPEPHVHREKTPPPPDASQGTGLADTAKYDAVPQYATVPHAYQNSNQPTPQYAYFPGAPHQPTPPGVQDPPSQNTPPHHIYSGSMPPPHGGPSPAYQQHQQVPTFTPPPMTQNSQPTSPPVQQQYFHSHTSFTGPPTTQYASYPTQTRAPSFGPNAVASPGMPQQSYGYGQQPPTPSAPPAYGIHTPLQSPGVPPPPPGPPPPQQAYQVQTHVQSQVTQQFGYSNYDYKSTQESQAHVLNQYGGYTGDIHTQLYRPTAEEEAFHHASHGGGHGSKGHGAGHGPAPQQHPEKKGMMENQIDKYEKKMSGFLRKFDKLI